jgi:Rps23 Pro-64 3,4-dihydroxylase Tpa1-like proline 4-hydroxylase
LIAFFRADHQLEQQNCLIAALQQSLQETLSRQKKREAELIEERNLLTSDLRQHIDTLALRNAELELSLKSQFTEHQSS